MIVLTIPSYIVHLDFFGLSKKFAEIYSNVYLSHFISVAISPKKHNSNAVSYPSISRCDFDLVSISP
jgi:hypothetical protein